MDFGAAYKETWDMISSADDHPLQKGGDSVSAEPKSIITVDVEPYEVAVKDLRPLFERHWQEIALYRDRIALKPNYQRYGYMAAAGGLRVYVAREAATVVGYVVFLLGKHLHYADDIYATNDIFWVLPESRGQHIATLLWDFVEADLAKLDVSIIRVETKALHPAAQRFLEGRKYDLVSIGYAKLLKRAPNG